MSIRKSELTRQREANTLGSSLSERRYRDTAGEPNPLANLVGTPQRTLPTYYMQPANSRAGVSMSRE